MGNAHKMLAGEMRNIGWEGEDWICLTHDREQNFKFMLPSPFSEYMPLFIKKPSINDFNRI
jgi:hypothetical protein